MKIRLFGKILLAFWLTLFVMSQGLWFLYAAKTGALGPEQREMRIGGPVMTLLAHRVATSGPLEARSELRLLPDRLRNHISIVPSASTREVVNGNGLRIVRQATAPDGRRYLLVYSPPGSGGSFDISPKYILADAVAGLIFSFCLSLYLTRPLTELRQGFRRMARGDLDVQLEHRIGRRGDEISELARDFDVMAVRLRQLIGARDRLLNDVSHELRSPLTRLQLAIGLARQDPNRTEDSLERIDREARKLETMVHELLALARAESGAAEDVDEYFDPIAVVESVVSDAQFEAQMGGREVRLEAPELDGASHPSIRGSAELVRRAIENVVRNALRFSPRGGLVEVAVGILPAPLRYRFVVADAGAGVDAASLADLFDPFVHGDPAGVGLGLAIAKRAILAHRGRITARNRSGGGFIVEIEIPAVTHDAPADAGGPTPSVSGPKEL